MPTTGVAGAFYIRFAFIFQLFIHGISFSHAYFFCRRVTVVYTVVGTTRVCVLVIVVKTACVIVDVAVASWVMVLVKMLKSEVTVSSVTSVIELMVWVIVRTAGMTSVVVVVVEDTIVDTELMIRPVVTVVNTVELTVVVTSDPVMGPVDEVGIGSGSNWQRKPMGCWHSAAPPRRALAKWTTLRPPAICCRKTQELLPWLLYELM